MLENIQMPEKRDHRHQEDLTEDLWLRKKKKIMVIDDDMDFRLGLSEILTDHGYAVTTAKDGEIALNHLMLDNDRPDLILVDLMMPVKGGLEFRREQNKLEEISQIPVIFMTGHGVIDGELTLQKPFDETEMIDTLKKYC